MRGNILIVIILLVIVGFILFSQVPKFFGGEPQETKPERPSFQPSFEEKTTITPQLQRAEKEPESSEEKTKEPDNSPPVLSNPQPTGVLPFQTRKIYLKVETDEKATCRYSDISGVYYEYMQDEFSTEDGFSHQALITTLSEGQDYVYYVRCIDEEGNKNKEDFIISFRVGEPEDTTPPKRINFYPTGDILPAGTKSTIIGLTTDEPAFCRYDIEPGVDYRSMDHKFSADKNKRYHTATISGLTDGQSYGFYVRCKDLVGNKNTGDVLIWFEVEE